MKQIGRCAVSVFAGCEMSISGDDHRGTVSRGLVGHSRKEIEKKKRECAVLLVDYTELQDFLRYLREKVAKATQEELASEIGVDVETVKHWEPGRRQPSQKHLLVNVMHSLRYYHLQQAGCLKIRKEALVRSYLSG